MSYPSIRKALEIYGPVLSIECIFPHNKRRVLKRLIGVLALFGMIITVALTVGGNLASKYLPHEEPYINTSFVLTGPIKDKIFGLTLIIMAVWLKLTALEAYFYSHFFYRASKKQKEQDANLPRMEIASIIFTTKNHDTTKSFIESRYGEEIFARCGIQEKNLAGFLEEREIAGAANAPEENTRITTLSNLAMLLSKTDAGLKKFLLKHAVTEEIFMEVSSWVERKRRAQIDQERWWSRERLEKIGGIGEDWAYGETYLLARYGVNIAKTRAYDAAAHTSGEFGKQEIEQLSTVLGRTAGANALLVGEEGMGLTDIIAKFTREVEEGEIQNLYGKHVFQLEVDPIMAASPAGGKFESEIIKLFNQTVAAGNVILVLRNLPAFMDNARAIGVDFANLIDPYLESAKIQIVATADREARHRTLASNTKLVSRFESIQVGDIKSDILIRLLEDKCYELEIKEGVFFTFPALEAISENAEVFAYGVMPDKALDLMLEVAVAAREYGQNAITKETVLRLIKKKTGVPLGAPTEEERARLAQLENLLHEKVVGQEPAIKALSEALRRVRAGIGERKRPMGSFLFLGPTGVGKTQTAKALSAVFFAGERDIIRFDMSEYNGEDALNRLIGSFETNRPGTLSSALREKPYGVLLLDEFEKAHTEVLDLFLQILDEGYFSDMRGRRVSARNTIIIATSNAGSDLIWQYFDAGENPSEHQSQLINTLISRGTFKPELINRFDAAIVYHPLNKKQLREIAKIMLSDLAERLTKQGMTLKITDDLLTLLVEYGYDPKFGARPMRRALQDKIENIIAKKVLSKEYKAGDMVEIKKSEI